MMKILFKITIFISLIYVCFCFVPSNFEPIKDVLFVLRIKNRDFKKDEILNLNEKEDLENTAFDVTKPIFFHVHGYTEDRRVVHHVNMDKAILDINDINLFFVDWGKGSKTLDYNLARGRVNDVAKTIGEFINFMSSKYKISPSNICCAGFSLGAHICGLIHNHLTSGTLRIVYGLDPAGPLFDVNDPITRIGTNSASYVECFHTGFPLGIRAPLCHVDFFFNKGFTQPGCSNIFGVDNFVCSHGRAVEYITEAIKTPKSFYGMLCSSYENALEGKCDESGAYVIDKENSVKNISGIFHVVTNSKEPYGRGKE